MGGFHDEGWLVATWGLAPTSPRVCWETETRDAATSRPSSSTIPVTNSAFKSPARNEPRRVREGGSPKEVRR